MVNKSTFSFVQEFGHTETNVFTHVFLLVQLYNVNTETIFMVSVKNVPITDTDTVWDKLKITLSNAACILIGTTLKKRELRQLII